MKHIEIHWDIGSKRWEWYVSEYGRQIASGIATTKKEAENKAKHTIKRDKNAS